MKAARMKIAEQAKQRDCTQRMETQLWDVSDEVMCVMDKMYDLQTSTARKPLAKTHSVLVMNKANMYVLNFELHKVISNIKVNTVISGDDELNHLCKTTVEKLKAIASEDVMSDKEAVELVVDESEKEGEDNDN